MAKLTIHRNKERIIEKWKEIYAKGLYWNNEIKRNVIEDLAVIQCLNEHGHYDENSVKTGKTFIENELKNVYGSSDVLNVIKSSRNNKISGYRIIKECIKGLCIHNS